MSQQVPVRVRKRALVGVAFSALGAPLVALSLLVGVAPCSRRWAAWHISPATTAAEDRHAFDWRTVPPEDEDEDGTAL